jgi:hypothetical protein
LRVRVRVTTGSGGPFARMRSLVGSLRTDPVFAQLVSVQTHTSAERAGIRVCVRARARVCERHSVKGGGLAFQHFPAAFKPTGGCHRRSPTGGAAYGIPVNAHTSVLSHLPTTLPQSTPTTPEVASMLFSNAESCDGECDAEAWCGFNDPCSTPTQTASPRCMRRTASPC